jgi:squalene-hopene/tetraprenyl-beta-curcumene cyclase
MATLALDPTLPADRLADSIDAAEAALLARRQADGHWVFELEADATIPAEYVLLEHYLNEIDDAVEMKIGVYLRRIQNPDGGWPLFHRGDSDVSATVKAYYALKLIGDPVEAPHMARARERVLALGGAAKCNVFTRFALALFGQVPWRAVPCMPIELVMLPSWFPFHLDKISYWSRTVVTPLLVLGALRPRARNPRRVDVRELFSIAPEKEMGYMRAATPTAIGSAFLALDAVLKRLEPFVPKKLRGAAVAKAIEFTTQRLNGEDGLGAIFPAIVNSVMALDAIGRGPTDPELRVAKSAVRKLLVEREREAYCQPCVSPIWDTSLVAHALFESGGAETGRAIAQANDWLRGRQVLDVVGDWAPAAGPSSIGTISTPTSTTRRSWRWRCTAKIQCATASRWRARPNGSWACSASTAAGAPSMPRIPITN